MVEEEWLPSKHSVLALADLGMHARQLAASDLHVVRPVRPPTVPHHQARPALGRSSSSRYDTSSPRSVMSDSISCATTCHPVPPPVQPASIARQSSRNHPSKN